MFIGQKHECRLQSFQIFTHIFHVPEEAVEILGRGDKESARNLLRQAGIELLDSPGDLGEQGGVSRELLQEDI